MTIGTDALINFWEGSRDSLANTTSAVSAGTFSDGTNDLNVWTNTDDSPYATFVLKVDPASAPAAGSFYSLYAVLVDIDIAGTGDTPVPTVNFPEYYIGRFRVKNDAAAQVLYGEFFLPSAKTQQGYNFYIRNQTDVSLDAGWDLEVDSKTVGPHA